MESVKVRSVSTGAVEDVFVHSGGLVNGYGDGFSPAYIHSELFGGAGAVVVIAGGTEAVRLVEALLEAYPPLLPDRRVF